MRVLTGEQTMVRIFFGESDRWHYPPLETALLERPRREGFARGDGFPRSGRLRRARHDGRRGVAA